jgi:hypothetical protein
MSAGSVDGPGGVEVMQRQLGVTFLNRKDVPVSVWDLRVCSTRGDSPSVPRSARACSSRASTAGGTVRTGAPPSTYTRDANRVRRALHQPRKAAAIARGGPDRVRGRDRGGQDRTQLARWNDLTPQEKRY